MKKFICGGRDTRPKGWNQKTSGKRFSIYSILEAVPLIAAVCLEACAPSLQQADLEEFITTGSTNVIMRSATFREGSTALSRAVSGKPVTCDLDIINPESLDVSYTLGWDVDTAVFTTLPPTAPVPSDADNLSFSFVLNPSAAEHRTITFSLGKYVASLDRTYDTSSFSILCDSPPNPASRVSVIMDSAQKSALAVLLPTGPSDDDLSNLRITWGREGTSTTMSGTYAISSLAGPLPAASFASPFNCFFQASDCVAGCGYSYEVVVIDSAGQESSPVTISNTGNSFFVRYDGNGNTSGTAPASVGYRFGATAVASSPGTLAKADYLFSHWNTAADGSLTSYSPGASFTIPAGDVTLYAQWIRNGTGVIIDIPTNYQALTFANSAPSITRGLGISFKTNNSTLAALSSGWTWYMDGVVQGETSEELTLDAVSTSAMLGSYLITARVTYAGVTYSGSLTLTVHR